MHKRAAGTQTEQDCFPELEECVCVCVCKPAPQALIPLRSAPPTVSGAGLRTVAFPADHRSDLGQRKL